MSLLAAALGTALFLSCSPGLAAQEPTGSGRTLQVSYKGLILQADSARPGVEEGFTPATQPEGIEALKRAVDLIQAKSAFSVKALQTLQANGRVVILYNPEMRAANNGLFTLASFYPDFYKRNDPNGRKDFVVIVGRHAIKWPSQELAMILVHELVGHGIQHLQGWLDFVREIDLECNANLYAERFYQDIGIDKHSREVVEFRRALEGHWCADFKIYLRDKNPELPKLWDVLNPDVPKLLALFDQYIAELRRTGVAQQAIDAAKQKRTKEIDEGVRRDAFAGNSDAQYQLGRMYLDGIGLNQDFAEAAAWFLKAARQGDARAQTEVGLLYARGKGVAQDYNLALSWLAKAADQGDGRAARLAREVRTLAAGTQAQ